jgi:hypothetical protein
MFFLCQVSIEYKRQVTKQVSDSPFHGRNFLAICDRILILGGREREFCHEFSRIFTKWEGMNANNCRMSEWYE